MRRLHLSRQRRFDSAQFHATAHFATAQPSQLPRPVPRRHFRSAQFHADATFDSAQFHAAPASTAPIPRSFDAPSSTPPSFARSAQFASASSRRQLRQRPVPRRPNFERALLQRPVPRHRQLRQRPVPRHRLLRQRPVPRRRQLLQRPVPRPRQLRKRQLRRRPTLLPRHGLRHGGQACPTPTSPASRSSASLT